MSNDRAYDDIHDTTDLAALQQQEAERAQVEEIASSVPGESDTAASGGQGADDRYRDGELGGGAIGGAVDDDKETQ